MTDTTTEATESTESAEQKQRDALATLLRAAATHIADAPLTLFGPDAPYEAREGVRVLSAVSVGVSFITMGMAFGDSSNPEVRRTGRGQITTGVRQIAFDGFLAHLREDCPGHHQEGHTHD